MSQEEFIKELDSKGYSYEMKGDKIVVTVTDYTKHYTKFGNIHLDSLETLPSGVVFENKGDIYLGSLISLPPGVEFKNLGDVSLNVLTSISPGVEFKNGKYVYLGSLIGGGGWLGGWKVNIKGIAPRRLFNKMIALGLFDRNK
jgi:hypothetical protein